MLSPHRTFIWILLACAAKAWCSEDFSRSQPSRLALYQRDMVCAAAADRAAPAPFVDPMAALRRALFKRAEPVIVALPHAAAEPAAGPITIPASLPARSRDAALRESADLSAPASSRPIAVSPPQPAPLIIPAPPASRESPVLRELALQPTSFTPYDRYLGVVRGVISNLAERGPSISLACKLMREAHGFRYAARDPYRADAPSVTAARRAGDCKSKALWLYDRLGDPDAFYVIGKATRRARSSHAWVYWRYQSRWWILDPTNRAAPIAVDSVSADRYVPYYSFARSGTYRHPATQLLLAQEKTIVHTPAVASRASKRKARRR
jgi:hypothetical protein